MTPPVAAAPHPKISEGPDTVILIHGAWQGSWAWNALVPYLRAAGIVCVAVDLPGNGHGPATDAEISLQTYLDHIGKLLAKLPGQVSLVGHSAGGIVATAVAENFRERVSRIAFIAGMMLPSGVAFATVQKNVAETAAISYGITGELQWSADGRQSSVPLAAAKAILFSDCPTELATSAAERLTPQPEGGRAINATFTPERFGSLPRLYVEATKDRSIDLLLQRRMQELVPGALVVSLPTGHTPQLSAPDLLANSLIPFLLGETDCNLSERFAQGKSENTQSKTGV